MKKLFLSIVSGSLFLFAVSIAKAEISYGVSLMVGQTDVSGHELENANVSDKNKKDITEQFIGGSLFVETSLANGMIVGLDFVPLGIEIGDGSRKDTSGSADVASEADTGTRTSSAELKNMFTLYTNIPLEDTGFYLLGGVHMVTVSPSATLPNSKYDDEDIFGGQIGLGKQVNNMQIELFYSDFEDINLSGTGGNNNKIEADADALGLKVKYSF